MLSLMAWMLRKADNLRMASSGLEIIPDTDIAEGNDAALEACVSYVEHCELGSTSDHSCDGLDANIQPK